MKLLITSLFGWFIAFCSYFCFWVISDHLLADPIVALFFLPFSLRLALILHAGKGYWYAIYAAEWCVLTLLALSYPELNFVFIYLLSLLSLPLSHILHARYRTETKQWKKLILLGYGILATATLNTLLFYFIEHKLVFLISISGGLLILPVCYLLADFLFNRKWVPVSAGSIHTPLNLRANPILIYALLLIGNIYIQTQLPNEFRRFSLFCLAIPIILLAFRYGWQGALLGTLLNAVALIAAMQSISSPEINDLLLVISAQTITGVFLGSAIQYQRDLNHTLSRELKRNKLLTRQLISTEESVRKDISRELHDEIGQNITAIRTQAALIKYTDSVQKNQKYADTIEKLSLNIYDTTKDLLNRIRPRVLDDLNLQQAIQNLLLEFNFAEHNVRVEFKLDNPAQIKLDNLLEMTLYRLCQESLNNIAKYAQAKHILLSVTILEDVEVIIRDDGIGFESEHLAQGRGLAGMKERVAVLGGQFTLESIPLEGEKERHGTTIRIRLPIL
ncbi:two-component system sensor histidine kinase UhpB [Mesocricetibacter intestinalis]|uniref:Two-component system sensor histidine kinase UhpB n=1 Tax=Mesocricetibacter intestinalis TaxID=1521930 RepID=A0A4R6V7E0_9PAST|nr:signal transduction histidine-protein kinase/phosphatase UhpB [Mesocricetibacter intestinalis]TDQ57009.1 two-component system sensor histidine kinase UhpB [Mesocricetibacter intestinalis]